MIKPADLQVAASSAQVATGADRRAEVCRAGHLERASLVAAYLAFVEDDDCLSSVFDLSFAFQASFSEYFQEA